MKRLLTTLVLTLFLAGPAWAGGGSGVMVETLAKSSESWNGASLPAYAKGQPEVTILKISIAPGTTLPLHRHTVMNAGVMLSGELTVITDKDEVLKLKAGDPIIEVVDQWHFGRNDGSETAVIIILYAGIKGEPLTIKK